MYDEPEWDRVGVRAHEKSARKPDDVTALLADVLAFLGGIRGDSPRGRLAARVEAALACSSEPISAGSMPPSSSDRDAVTCPFCHETDFDLIGLKLHIINWCEAFNLADSPPTVG